MNDVAIRVEHLSKRYRIGRRQPYRTFRETVTTVLGAPFRRLRPDHQHDAEREFLALNDVSFEVNRGEVIGIIGRNGAGKSTLLKVLSRITEPTSGRVEINGRVGSLLEVGTGFHAELTGRENVYLNGAILGMKRAEIAAKFDEIVAFAEVEKFLDTPVKHYSSGMYMRLAFAVAAHLEPEILIVDEVLAVGDAAFQKKCLGKMGEVASRGRTVLFVSHNMQAVSRLCHSCVLLAKGTVAAKGLSADVIAKHLRPEGHTTAARLWHSGESTGNGIVRLDSVRAQDADRVVCESFDIRQPIDLVFEFDVLQDGAILSPHFQLANEEETVVFAAIETDPAWRGRPRPAGHYVASARIPGNLLAEGSLYVSVAISRFDPLSIHVHEVDAISFRVVDSLGGDSARGDFAGNMPGIVRPLLEWTTSFSAQRTTLETRPALSGKIS